jgi:hypothetical protein
MSVTTQARLGPGGRLLLPLREKEESMGGAPIA